MRVGEGAPALVLGFERSHADELGVLDQIVGCDIDLAAAGGEVRLAADAREVAIEAGAELPALVGGLGRRDAEQRARLLRRVELQRFIEISCCGLKVDAFSFASDVPAVPTRAQTSANA